MTIPYADTDCLGANGDAALTLGKSITYAYWSSRDADRFTIEELSVFSTVRITPGPAGVRRD